MYARSLLNRSIFGQRMHVMRSFATITEGARVPSALASVVAHDGENGF